MLPEACRRRNRSPGKGTGCDGRWGQGVPTARWPLGDERVVTERGAAPLGHIWTPGTVRRPCFLPREPDAQVLGCVGSSEQGRQVYKEDREVGQHRCAGSGIGGEACRAELPTPWGPSREGGVQCTTRVARPLSISHTYSVTAVGWGLCWSSTSALKPFSRLHEP